MYSVYYLTIPKALFVVHVKKPGQYFYEIAGGSKRSIFRFRMEFNRDLLNRNKIITLANHERCKQNNESIH